MKIRSHLCDDASCIPAIARTVGSRMRAVHSLLMYLFTEISFAVATNQSAVMATSYKRVDAPSFF